MEGGYIYFNKTTGSITGCDETVTSAVIPDTIKGVSVTIISGAFENCNKLTKPVIPESVTFFNIASFKDCNGLKTAGPIGSGCNYEFGWKTELPGYVFSEHECLTAVTIPEGITYIRDNAFKNCTALTEVKLPATLEAIGNNAFENCESLTSLNIPYGTKTIGYTCFKDCTELESVAIPATVTTIENGAFENCYYLTVYCTEGSYSDNNGLYYITMKGIVDLDKITKQDAALTMRKAVGILSAEDGEAYKDASFDLNGDNKVDMLDVIIILKAATA